MSRRLPPLNAVRAFEAAARHLSVTRAARELNVTQAAVSHQIKALEDRLGLPLFRRINRGLQLTPAGQTLLPPVREALDRIADAIGLLTNSREGVSTLTVSTLPSFASKWLVLRLGRFRGEHPELDVRLYTSHELVDFTREDVDVAIRLGRPPWPGIRADLLMTEDIFPVCSPGLLQGPVPLKQPSDLKHHLLLHDDYMVTWAMWLAAAGVRGIDAERGPRFTDSSILIQAVVDGQGVALARQVLVADDLAQGRLVRLFDVKLPGNYAYYVAAPPANFSRPAVAAFHQWLKQEVAEG